MQLETPQLTTPELVRDRLQQRLEFVANKMRQVGCANAVIIITPASIDEEKKTVHPGDIQYSKDHCPNDRRNGSKFCQKCSDKHHGK